MAFDVTVEGDCQRLVEDAVDRWGRLDLLDNNVGIGAAAVWSREIGAISARDAGQVETMFLVSKHAIPAMIKTANGGAIVNISSISALRPRGLTTYRPQRPR